MITETINKFKKMVGVNPDHNWSDNEWKEIKIQSTVDEGKHLTNIERKQHLYKEIRK